VCSSDLAPLCAACATRAWKSQDISRLYDFLASAALRELQQQGEAALAKKSYSREMSWDFHALVAQAAHNGAIEGLTHSFRSSLSMHPIRTREGARAHALTVEEHGRILDALVAHDGARARQEMAKHLLRGTNLEKRESELLELWAAQPAGPKRRAK